MVHLDQEQWAIIEKLLKAKKFALEGVTIDSNVYRHQGSGHAIRFRIDFPLMKFDHHDVVNGNTMSLIALDVGQLEDIRIVMARVYQLGKQSMPEFLRAPKVKAKAVMLELEICNPLQGLW